MNTVRPQKALFGLACLAAALLQACLGGPSVSPSAGGDPSAALDKEGFLAALHDAGLAVEETEEREDALFPIAGAEISVQGEAVFVYEYPDAAAAEKAIARVSPDGTKVEQPAERGRVALDITWPAPPHFYRRGRIIALYVGENATITEVLQDILGPQFAGQ